MTMSPRLRHVAAVNPPSQRFLRLADSEPVTFLPLEAIWPYGRLDTSRTRLKGEVASGYTVFQDGDVLLPKITPTFEAGRSAVAHGLQAGVGAGSTELHVVRTDGSVSPRYINYCLLSHPFLRKGEAAMRGVAGQRRVPDQWLRDLEIVHTNFSQQEKIADELDDVCGAIEDTLELQRQLLASVAIQLQEQLDALIIPQADEMIPFRRLLLEPPKYGAAESGGPAQPDWVRYIRITDIAGDGTLREDSAKYLPPELGKRYQVRPGDLLVARSGATVGKAYLHHEGGGVACYAGYLIRFRIDADELLPQVVEAWTQTRHYWDQLRVAGSQSTIENVNASQYKRLTVPKVGRSQQAKVAGAAADMRATARTTLSSIRREIAVLEERRRAVITKRVLSSSGGQW